MSEAVEIHQETRKDNVHTQVDYLPATKSYEHLYSYDTPLATVRSDSMGFFGVADHRDRDVHEFFLTFNGQRITDLSHTIEQLVGEKHEVKFDLVEQITPGAA